MTEHWLGTPLMKIYSVPYCVVTAAGPWIQYGQMLVSEINHTRASSVLELGFFKLSNLEI